MNSVDDAAHGIHVISGLPLLINCILWGEIVEVEGEGRRQARIVVRVTERRGRSIWLFEWSEECKSAQLPISLCIDTDSLSVEVTMDHSRLMKELKSARDLEKSLLYLDLIESDIIGRSSC